MSCQAVSTWPHPLVDHAAAHGDRPAIARPPLSEPIPQGELGHVAVHRAGGPHPEREAHVAAEAGRLVRVPGAAVVEERSDPHADQAPQLVAHQDAVLQREPHHARARKLMGAEHTWSFLQHPQVELGARLGSLERAGFGVQNEHLAPEVLARDGDGAAHPPAVEATRPRRVHAVRGAAQHDETARPDGARLTAQLRPYAGPIRRVAPRSEEHTSELQSQFHLVCRLLLEKKKNRTELTNSYTAHPSDKTS